MYSEWILVYLAVPMLMLLAITIGRLWRGIGFEIRFIQIAVVFLVIPSGVLLALEDKLTAPISGLLGTVTGYVLSGLGKEGGGSGTTPK